MPNRREIEQLADLADAERNGSSANRPALKLRNPYSLRHTHRINGIGIEQIRHADPGMLNHAAGKLASLMGITKRSYSESANPTRRNRREATN